MGSCVGKRTKTQIRNGHGGRKFVLEGQLMDRFTEHQVKILRDRFNKHKPAQGYDKKSVLNLFPLIRCFPVPVQSRCFALFSRDSVSIDFRDFCIIISKLLLSSKEDQSDFVFELFDCDNDGLLKESELDTLLRSQELYIRKLSENSAENIKLQKEKFNKIPVSKEEFVHWSLRNLELSELLKPFELIPSALTEKQVILAKMANWEKAEGDELFLISFEWWVAWKMYVRYQEENDEEFEISINNLSSIHPANRTRPFALGDRPIEIFNRNLLENGRLIKGAKEGVDFVAVKKEIWDQLYLWYGGGPVICRNVIKENGKVFLDLYPLIYSVLPVDENGVILAEKKKTVALNKNSQMRDLVESVCSVFDRQKDITRILYQRNGTWDHLVNPEGNIIPLVPDGSEILIETSFTEKGFQVWPSERKERAKSGSETSANDTGPQVAPDPKKPEKSVAKAPSAIIPGISGLSNLGNTCYLNSVLQSLLHTPMFEKFFIGDMIANFLNPRIKNESLSIDLNFLAKEMFLSKNSRVTPKKFHKNFVKRFPIYEGNAQHDAHECLSLILNTLHEELSRQGEGGTNSVIALENPQDRKIEIEKADEQWKNLQGSTGSPISDVCGGQTRRTLTCEKCGYKKVLFEVFYDLSLPVPASMEIAIQATVVYRKKKAAQFGVLINKFLKIGELVQEISNLADVPKDKLLVSFYYTGSPVITLRNCEQDPIFKRLRDNSHLTVYEIITTLDEAESMGKKWAGYGNVSGFSVGQHVDVKLNGEWKPGKIKEIEGGRYKVDLDYEDKNELFSLSDVAQFRSYTSFENPRILHIHIYNQILRNGKAEMIGFPYLISIGNWYTFQDIANIVSSNIEIFRINKGDTLGYGLKIIENSTLKCAICKKCDGCPLPSDRTDLRCFENLSLSVVWEDGAFFQDISVHDSVSEVEQQGKKSPIDISECFNSFTKTEKVDLECEKCKHREHSTQVDIWRVPDILILCLVRFAYQHGSFDKIDSAVTIPFYAFDISQWVKGVETSGGMTLSTTTMQNAYDLYSVIQHSGSIEAGHYTNLIKVNQPEDSIWLSLDDGNITVMKEDLESLQVMQNSYMLFYKRRKLSSSNVITLISNFA